MSELDTVGQVGAVVVSYNSGALVGDCIASLRAAMVREILVVDNASTDGSIETLIAGDHDVQIIAMGKNLGYGTAANRGVAQVEAPYVLICNTDLVVDVATPAALAAVLNEHDDVGVVGPRITETDGEVYPSARTFPNLVDAAAHALVGLFHPDNPWTKRYRLGALGQQQSAAVDWVSGACMLVRRVAFESVGGFDEGYFMYVEDLDLCWRLSRAAWMTWYVPSATVIHDQGGSSHAHPQRLLMAHHLSTWRFARKSISGPQRCLLPIIGLGIAGRLAISLVRSVQKIDRSGTGPLRPLGKLSLHVTGVIRPNGRARRSKRRLT